MKEEAINLSGVIRLCFSMLLQRFLLKLSTLAALEIMQESQLEHNFSKKN